MNKHKKVLGRKAAMVAAVVLLVMLAAWTSPAFVYAEGANKEGQHQTGAQETHATQEGEHHGFNWVGFFGKLFDSTLLFGGLIFLVRKPLIALLAQKSLDIKTDIIDRENQLKNTTVQLKGIMERLEKIAEEVEAVKDSAEKSGNEEKKRIEEAGENEAQRILALTEEEIGNKMETAVRELKERIADLTIEHFKKDIEAHLDPRMHERLIEKNIAVLSGETIERK
ncbi:MAG: synthase subunit b [Acidobacteriota bacterium]|nr:synthase subunit b [Acidobacteriota bacterium]